jgi:nicotinate phosphoribosyltransferase
MSMFNGGERLTNKVFKLDVERMRTGWYSDKYFENVGHLLEGLIRGGYIYQGTSPRPLPCEVCDLEVGGVEVEMQWFTRRRPYALVAGVDKALSMLRHCTGYTGEDGRFVETWERLEVRAVHDGMFTHYDGDPMNVQPVIKARGPYWHFAMLETPTLGILSRASRIATNVYNVLKAAHGKPVLFFPARFDVHEVQAADGYAYDIAVKRFNKDFGQKVTPMVSTDAQGDWWGGYGGGTVPHAVIACFLGDTVEAMLAFAALQPPDVPRVALVDFNNNCVKTSVAVLTAYWDRYRDLKMAGDDTEAARYRMFGVRLDTSSNTRDDGLEPMGMPELDLGVNPRLVTTVREAINGAWASWHVPSGWEDEAKAFCHETQIVVSGGFNPDKIKLFERLQVPVDAYGVGSSLMANDQATNTDFTADVVRVKLDGQWADMAKVGRRSCENPDLEMVDLAPL